MRTSTLAASLLALGIALGAGCRPERSGTTEAPSQGAPEQSVPGPASAGAPRAEAPGMGGPVNITATQGEAVDPSTPMFTVAGLAFTRPEGWALEAPGPMRAAQLANPSIPEGAIVFTHFGARGAGSVTDNLTRWARQVVDDAGEPTLPETTEATAEVDGVRRRITFARYQGTYMAGTPGQTPTARPNTLFFGAIVEGGPEGTVYMRAHGPSDAMRGQAQAIFAMLMAQGGVSEGEAR